MIIKKDVAKKIIYNLRGIILSKKKYLTVIMTFLGNFFAFLTIFDHFLIFL